MIFGNLSKTIQFMFLSIAIIFMVFKGRNDFFLQGMGHYSKLAKSKSFGALFGLIVSMPIYYYLGIEAIPIVIVLGAIIMYMTSTYYFKKLNLQRVKINSKQTFQRGIEMAKLGLVMVGGQIFGAIVINSINIFISSSGSVSDLGLYNAGISITTGYVGMIFTAMSVELLPRLSSVSYDNKQISSMVNQQSEILLIVLLPLLVIMIYLAPLMIKILLTDEFSNITLFIRIMALTLIIRVPAFTIGYIPIAKGEKRIFFIYNSFLPGIFAMIFSMLGYYYFNLTGLAFASVLTSFIHFLLLFYKCYHLYGFKFSNKHTYHLFVTLSTLLMAIIVVELLPSSVFFIAFGATLIFLSIYHSYYNLNKLIDIKHTVKSLVSRIRI